jgi:hypothetical protein
MRSEYKDFFSENIETGVDALIGKLKQLETQHINTAKAGKAIASGTSVSDTAGLEKQIDQTQKLSTEIKNLQDQIVKLQTAKENSKKATIEEQEARKQEIANSRLIAKLNITEEGSRARLVATVNGLTNELNHLGNANTTNANKAASLRKEIESTQKQVDKMGTSMQKGKSHVGEYTQGIKDAITQNVPFAGSIMNIAGKFTSLAGGGIALAVGALATFAEGIKLNEELSEKLGSYVSYMNGLWQSLALNLTGVSSNMFEVAAAFREAHMAEKDLIYTQSGHLVLLAQLEEAAAKSRLESYAEDKGYTDKRSALADYMKDLEKIKNIKVTDAEKQAEINELNLTAYGIDENTSAQLRSGLQVWSETDIKKIKGLDKLIEKYKDLQGTISGISLGEAAHVSGMGNIFENAQNYAQQNDLIDISGNTKLKKVTDDKFKILQQGYANIFQLNADFNSSLKRVYKQDQTLAASQDKYKIDTEAENQKNLNNLIKDARTKDLAIESAENKKLIAEKKKQNLLNGDLATTDLNLIEKNYYQKKAEINYKYNKLEFDLTQKTEKSKFEVIKHSDEEIAELTLQQWQAKLAFDEAHPDPSLTIKKRKEVLDADKTEILKATNDLNQLKFDASQQFNKAVFEETKKNKIQQLNEEIIVINQEIDYQQKQLGKESAEYKKYLELKNALIIKYQNEMIDIQREAEIQLEKSNEERLEMDLEVTAKTQAQKDAIKRKGLENDIRMAQINYDYELTNNAATTEEKQIAANNLQIAKDKLLIWDKTEQEKANKELTDAAIQATEYIVSQAQEATKKKMALLDMEYEASKQHEDTLRALAASRTEGALDNLAFEQKRQAEIQKEKIKLLKEELHWQELISTVKIADKLTSSDKGGAGNLSDLLSSIKGFETGGLVEGGEQLIRINEVGKEFVTNAAATAKYKPVLQDINMMQFNPMNYLPLAKPVNDDSGIINKLEGIENAIKNQSVLDDIKIDKFSSAVLYQFKKGNETIITRKPCSLM